MSDASIYMAQLNNHCMYTFAGVIVKVYSE